MSKEDIFRKTLIKIRDIIDSTDNCGYRCVDVACEIDKIRKDLQ